MVQNVVSTRVRLSVPHNFTRRTLESFEKEMSQQQQLTAEQANEVLTRVRNEVQQQTLQELISKVGEKCFVKCVPKPSSKLSSSEQKCLAMCMDRYVETMTVVGQAMQERGQQE